MSDNQLSLQQLQEKASDFFNQYFKKYASSMKCTGGCSHCCIDQLTIFTWEAQLILDWFASLDESERKERLKQCAQGPESFTNVEGQKNDPCVFLNKEGLCQIYERRPIICRTQGMGLKWSEDGQVKRDHCPLNFTEETSLQSDEADELNLDVINNMSSQAQMIYEQHSPEKSFTQTRVSLRELKKLLK